MKFEEWWKTFIKGGINWSSSKSICRCAFEFALGEKERELAFCHEAYDLACQERDAFSQKLALNAKMLARQCDLAREAETKLEELRNIVRAFLEFDNEATRAALRDAVKAGP